MFDAAMIAKSSAVIAALIPAFDFTPYGMIADIGGDRGHILAAVLAAAPRAKGILFDRLQVISNVAPSDRVELRAGDFFHDTLPSADAYLLGTVLHDWADPEAIAILRSIRRAAHAGSQLLVLECNRSAHVNSLCP